MSDKENYCGACRTIHNLAMDCPPPAPQESGDRRSIPDAGEKGAGPYKVEIDYEKKLATIRGDNFNLSQWSLYGQHEAESWCERLNAAFAAGRRQEREHFVALLNWYFGDAPEFAAHKKGLMDNVSLPLTAAHKEKRNDA